MHISNTTGHFTSDYKASMTMVNYVVFHNDILGGHTPAAPIFILS